MAKQTVDCKGEYYLYNGITYGPGKAEVPNDEVANAIRAKVVEVSGERDAMSDASPGTQLEQMNRGALLKMRRETLLQRARELGVDDSDSMTKAQLADSILEFAPEEDEEDEEDEE